MYKQGIDQLVEATEENQPGSFHGDFHMEFCDNKKQLFQAYFRDFTIERLEYPWQVHELDFFFVFPKPKIRILSANLVTIFSSF